MIESKAPETGEVDIAAAQEQRSVSPVQHSMPLQRRRRSSMADHTGRLLMDDSEENLAMLAPAGGLAPPSSPQDSSAGRGGYAGMPRHGVCKVMPCLNPFKAASLCCCCWGTESGKTDGIKYDSACLPLPAGRDVTTGLLLEDTSAPGGGDDVSGPLGQLRKRLTLLQGTQVNAKSSTFGLRS